MKITCLLIVKEAWREIYGCVRGFPDDSVVKHPAAKQDTWISSLDQEDPLEKEMATHLSILAWEIPWTEESGGALVHGVAKSWI